MRIVWYASWPNSVKLGSSRDPEGVKFWGSPKFKNKYIIRRVFERQTRWYPSFFCIFKIAKVIHEKLFKKILSFDPLWPPKYWPRGKIFLLGGDLRRAHLPCKFGDSSSHRKRFRGGVATTPPPLAKLAKCRTRARVKSKLIYGQAVASVAEQLQQCPGMKFQSKITMEIRVNIITSEITQNWITLLKPSQISETTRPISNPQTPFNSVWLIS